MKTCTTNFPTLLCAALALALSAGCALDSEAARTGSAGDDVAAATYEVGEESREFSEICIDLGDRTECAGDPDLEGIGDCHPWCQAFSCNVWRCENWCFEEACWYSVWDQLWLCDYQWWDDCLNSCDSLCVF